MLVLFCTKKLFVSFYVLEILKVWLHVWYGDLMTLMIYTEQ